VKIALDTEANAALDRSEFRPSDRPEFGEAHAEVTEPLGDVGVLRLDLGEEPGSGSTRIEELHHGMKVDLVGRSLHGRLTAAVVEELRELRLREELHERPPSARGSRITISAPLRGVARRGEAVRF